MRFRPSRGLGHGQQPQTPDREALQARAEVVGGTHAPEKVYDHRHTHEIDRAENIAAGLPPEGVPAEPAQNSQAEKAHSHEPEFRRL